MDMISELTDDLILKILSSLLFKDVVATSVLSKRWRSLWKLVPKLKVSDDSLPTRFWDSVSRSLAFSNPQLLQSMDFKIGPGDGVQKMNYWVKPAVYYCGLRELRIELLYISMKLPISLYTCGTLQTLILCRLSLEDVPLWAWLRSLKTLHLLSVKFLRDESVQWLLSICPVLEDLVVKRSTYVSVEIFTINVPTLRSLSIDYFWAVSQPAGVHGFVIKAPSLRYLNIRDNFSNLLRFHNMPQLVEANVEVVCDQSESLLGSLTSIRHLSLCSKTLKIPCHTNTFFFYLEHLELCTCSAEWWNLLAHILKHAPGLRVLKLKSIHCLPYNDPMDCSNQPSSVPVSVLEILEWRQYKGTKPEEEIAKYILANAVNLKMASFSSKSTEKYQMFKKLEFVPIISKECQLVFD